jgi:hypothetical protein
MTSLSHGAHGVTLNTIPLSTPQRFCHTLQITHTGSPDTATPPSIVYMLSQLLIGRNRDVNHCLPALVTFYWSIWTCQSCPSPAQSCVFCLFVCVVCASWQCCNVLYCAALARKMLTAAVTVKYCTLPRADKGTHSSFRGFKSHSTGGGTHTHTHTT